MRLSLVDSHTSLYSFKLDLIWLQLGGEVLSSRKSNWPDKSCDRAKVYIILFYLLTKPLFALKLDLLSKLTRLRDFYWFDKISLFLL